MSRILAILPFIFILIGSVILLTPYLPMSMGFFEDIPPVILRTNFDGTETNPVKVNLDSLKLLTGSPKWRPYVEIDPGTYRVMLASFTITGGKYNGKSFQGGVISGNAVSTFQQIELTPGTKYHIKATIYFSGLRGSITLTAEGWIKAVGGIVAEWNIVSGDSIVTLLYDPDQGIADAKTLKIYEGDVIEVEVTIKKGANWVTSNPKLYIYTVDTFDKPKISEDNLYKIYTLKKTGLNTYQITISDLPVGKYMALGFIDSEGTNSLYVVLNIKVSTPIGDVADATSEVISNYLTTIVGIAFIVVGVVTAIPTWLLRLKVK